MEVRLNRTVKTNGINAFIIFFLSVLPACVYAGFPVLVGTVFVQLIASPLPPTLTIYPMLGQKAYLNADFKLNLKSSIGVLPTDLRYLITNTFHLSDGTTSGIAVTNLAINGLPSGLTHVNNTPGDCPAQFQLNYGQSCTLHLLVDTDKYALTGDSAGPIVFMQLCWHWQSKRDWLGRRSKTSGCAPYYALPTVSQRITDVIPPIIRPTQGSITSTEQNGLQYDPTTLSIVGKPLRSGLYSYQVSATNGYSTAAPQTLQINVLIEPKDTPRFKNHYTLASAMPTQHYRLSLVDLIEPTPGFMTSNQISFRIDTNYPHPDWLSIDKEDATLLEGIVPSTDAGLEREITLIASSNTGGDSLPLTIKIPVAYDPSKKPILDKGIQLAGVAGATMHVDFRSQITDPMADNSLKIIIDKIEPAAPWLSMSSWNPLELVGIVPADAVGQDYQITLHANTAIGGDSESVIIPLEIAINKSDTPHFYLDNPQLPLLYVGQPYSYDFVANNDVDPEYEDIPYTVELAEGNNNPAWLRIEDNKLIVDSVPGNLDQIEQVFITIKNMPGGKSNVLSLKLFIME